MNLFFSFQSTSEMVLIACFYLCQYSSRSGFDWKQLFCPFVVCFTRCSAWHKIQLDRTQCFLGGKCFKLMGRLVSLIHRLPYHSFYFWESRGSHICRGPNLLLRRPRQARGNDISKAFLSYDGCAYRFFVSMDPCVFFH